MSTWGANASRVDRNIIEDGLDFILGHFQDCLFPRTISTKTTEGRQVPVYNKEEALARFKQADYLDCKISAYPKYVEWQGLTDKHQTLSLSTWTRVHFDQGQH
jgi:hypothetical protein